ncbi:MAG: DUF3006 domain-containing protein [Clostridia bacterium]|nr:DUF3006 domain-containing protein [Clostridia bacterium]
MSFTVDRFEAEFAVVITDDGSSYNIPKALLPEDAKEGSVINISLDKRKTEQKKQEVKNLLNSLFDETE